MTRAVSQALTSKILVVAAVLGAWSARVDGKILPPGEVDRFTSFLVALGIFRAWGGASLLLEERQTGMLSHLMNCPGSVRSMLRAGTLREGCATLAIVPSAALGAAVATTLGSEGLTAASILPIARDACTTAFLTGIVWSIAAGASLWGDFLAAFVAGILSIPVVGMLHRVNGDSLGAAFASWILAAALTWAMALGIERITESDTWRLRNCRR